MIVHIYLIYLLKSKVQASSLKNKAFFKSVNLKRVYIIAQ